MMSVFFYYIVKRILFTEGLTPIKSNKIYSNLDKKYKPENILFINQTPITQTRNAIVRNDDATR